MRSAPKRQPRARCPRAESAICTWKSPASRLSEDSKCVAYQGVISKAYKAISAQRGRKATTVGWSLADKAVPFGELPQRALGPRADMADDLPGSEAPEASAGRKRRPLGQPIEEPGGIEVARAGQIHDLGHELGGNLDRLACGHDHRACLGAGEDRHLA